MATLDWPTGAAWRPMRVRFGVNTPKSGWRAFYTGQRQSVSHLADRLRPTLWLPPARTPAVAAAREAFLAGISSTGDWVRFGHFRRPVPLGTARGTMTLASSAAAGARTVVITGVTPVSTGTLLAGDVLGIGGNLLMVAADCTANGSGQVTATLVTPLLAAASSGAAVTWNTPVGQFELVGDAPFVEYGAAGLQDGLQLEFSQVIP